MIWLQQFPERFTGKRKEKRMKKQNDKFFEPVLLRTDSFLTRTIQYHNHIYILIRYIHIRIWNAWPYLYWIIRNSAVTFQWYFVALDCFYDFKLWRKRKEREREREIQDMRRIHVDNRGTWRLSKAWISEPSVDWNCSYHNNEPLVFISLLSFFLSLLVAFPTHLHLQLWYPTITVFCFLHPMTHWHEHGLCFIRCC